MLSKLANSDEVNAAVVAALSGVILVLVAGGPGRVSVGRVLSGALSNPVPRLGSPGTRAAALRAAALAKPATGRAAV